MDWAEMIAKVLALFSLVVIVSIITVIPAMVIANHLFTPSFLLMVFGVPKLTLVKALWLNVLVSCLTTNANLNSKGNK